MTKNGRNLPFRSPLILNPLCTSTHCYESRRGPILLFSSACGDHFILEFGKVISV